MKLGKYILGLALVAVGLTSCDQDNVGAIYDGPAMPNYTFDSDTIDFEKEAPDITVPVVVYRTYSTDAFTTTVNMETRDLNLSLLTNEVSFAPGQDRDTLYVIATGMERAEKRSCIISFNDADKATANEFDPPIQEVVVNVIWPNLVPAGTCIITDYTWGDDDGNPMTAIDVPIVQVEGSDRYRIISPLYYIYKDDPTYGPSVDKSNFEFHLLSDGGAKVDDGTPLNYWGYLAYFDSQDYGSYCFVGNDGDTYDVNFLLLSGTSLYTGGRFVFVWDKTAEHPVE